MRNQFFTDDLFSINVSASLSGSLDDNIEALIVVEQLFFFGFTLESNAEETVNFEYAFGSSISGTLEDQVSGSFGLAEGDVVGPNFIDSTFLSVRINSPQSNSIVLKTNTPYTLVMGGVSIFGITFGDSNLLVSQTAQLSVSPISEPTPGPNPTPVPEPATALLLALGLAALGFRRRWGSRVQTNMVMAF